MMIFSKLDSKLGIMLEGFESLERKPRSSNGMHKFLKSKAFFHLKVLKPG